MGIPAKIETRLAAGLKRFQPVIAAALARDVNESDTVVIVTDMLQDIFGYDKYTEITSEYAIRGTYCDLAVKLDGKLQLLIEVKAIGLELRDAHIKQAIDYAANQGIEWVVLTNASSWCVYKVAFTKPIHHELVVEFEIDDMNHKDTETLERLWLISKEGWVRAGIGEYHVQKQALSRFTLGAVILSESVLEVIRREVRRISPGVRVESAELKQALETEVIKREVLEGDKAAEALKQISKASTRALRAKAREGAGVPVVPPVEPPA